MPGKGQGGQGGYVLVTALIAMGVLAVLGAAALGWGVSGLKLSRQSQESEQALYLANAGLEAALERLAWTTQTTNGSTVLTDTMTIAAGVTGSYQVTFVPEGGGVLLATSTGTVPAGGGSTRTVRARIGTAATVSPAYQYLIFSNQSISTDNHTEICGDVHVNGNLELRAQSTVWSKTKAQDPASPCDSIFGTGKVTATGVITVQGSSRIQSGQVCDSLYYWCGSTPAAVPMPNLNDAYFADLKAKATTVHTSSQTISAPPAAANAVVYVEGNITIPAAGLTFTNNITYVASGNITFGGHVRPGASCTPSTCAAAFISKGSQTVADNVEVSGVFATRDTAVGFTWGKFATIRGNIISPRVGASQHAVFYPVPYTTVALPPQVPGVSKGAGYTSWGD